MTTYSIRCRNGQCRHRRVSRTHPDDYKVVPPCPVCGHRKGWRIEQRAYNKRGLCNCSGPLGRNNEPFPHRITHPSCDQHPHGIYNQARARGVAHDDIPIEFHPKENSMDYPELLAKHDKLQEALDKAHERLENLAAASAIPMPNAVRLLALDESIRSLRDELRPLISYEPW